MDPKPGVIYSVVYLSLIKQQREGNWLEAADDDPPSVGAAGSQSRDSPRGG